MTQPEFSYLFDLTSANEKAQHVDAAASQDAMEALARRFEVERLEDMRMALDIAPHSLGFHVTGTVGALVEQTCVVTGAPLKNQVEGPIDYLAITANLEIDLDLDSLEEAYGVAEADIMDSTEFDLGELASQYLGLAIDPFARSDGAALDTEGVQQKHSPFAVLSALKDKA